MREPRTESVWVGREVTPKLDVIFEVLSHSRRRYVLYALHNSSNHVATFEELTEYVLEKEGIADPDYDSQLEVRTTLQHVHVPKLDESNLIEVDTRSETVRYWEQPALEEWLEHAMHKELD